LEHVADAPASSGQSLPDVFEDFRRTIKAYESQRENVVCDFMLLSDHEKYPDLAKRFSRQLGRESLAVIFPKAWVLKSKNVQDLSLAYAPCLAAAYEQSSKSHFDFSQIWDYRSTPAYRKGLFLKAAFFLGIVCFFALPPLIARYQSYQGLYQKYLLLTEEDKKLRIQTSQLEQQRQQNIAIKKKLLLQAEVVSDLKKISWSDTFLKITEVIPKDVWLDSFELSKEGQITLVGNGASLDAVAMFIRNLKTVTNFNEASLKSVRAIIVDKTAVQGFEIGLSIIVPPSVNMESQEQ
jgi:Tfp pilus assembly protein PilN